MLILSNVECDARSSHYFSFSFNFVSKRSIHCFFFFHRSTEYVCTAIWDEDVVNDEDDEEDFCKSLRKSLNVEDIWHLVWWNDLFLETCRSFRKLAFESRCKRMIKTIKICKDIAFFCMIEARSLLQIFEHACDFH